MRSSFLDSAECQLQLCMNKVTEWCCENGFKFSEEKTVVVHFTRKQGILPKPTLFLRETRITCKLSHHF